MAKQGAAKKEENPQPLFYKNPVPLMLDKHAEAAIKADMGFGFSKDTNSVPITMPEFAEVSKHYPIVFAATAGSEPVAVLGLEDRKNVFVKGEEWAEDKYIPAYVRRYPFAFMEAGSDADSKLLLCIDEDAKRFVKKAGKGDLKLFEDGGQSATTKHALDFCVQFHRDQASSLQFAKAVNDAGLFANKQISVTLKDREKPVVLAGFKVVDSEKLRALDDKKVAEWHKNGFLSLIYMHLVSLTNFTKLSKHIK